MPGTFFGIETGLRGLRTAQAAMHTASHNIANANTPGYSRQRAEIAATDPYTTPSAGYPAGAMQIGTGVEARTISQARDAALDTQLRGGLADHEALLAQQGALQQIEDALAEFSDNGINGTLTKLFNAFHNLAANAESRPLRGAVAANAEAAANSFREVAGRVQDVADDVDGRIQAGVAEINDLATKVAALNLSIAKVVGMGDEPNDLRDQRNVLLDTLAKKANTTVTATGNGQVTVQIGGVAVVRGDKALPVAGIGALTGDGDLTGGELSGLVAARGRVAAYQASLDGLANTFRTQLNAQHAQGLDLSGNPGDADLFTGTGAADLRLSAAVAADPGLLAAASAPTPPATFAVGNGDNALALAGFATRKLNAAPVADQTLRDFWSGTASALGVEVRALSDRADAAGAFTAQLERRRDAISGVSLDDEMADLARFQRAYQAAAKLISISDELTETIINGIGGRF
jgi:flagellar hook-associated protein 1 FlgK